MQQLATDQDGNGIDLEDYVVWLKEAQRLGLTVTHMTGKPSAYIPGGVAKVYPEKPMASGAYIAEKGVGLNLSVFAQFDTAKILEYAALHLDSPEIEVQIKYS